MSTYDSTKDTMEHKEHVKSILHSMIADIEYRAVNHDQSKLESPEKESFDITTPLLRNLTYGSDEYKETLRSMKPAIEHHYACNSHHPEYYANGINGMNLLDVLEMLCDWKAATMRHNDGDIHKSLEINAKRFHIDEQLTMILLNTIEDYFTESRHNT